MRWSDVSLLAFDTETTGMDVAVDRVVELGLVRFEARRPREVLAARLNPGGPIPSEATAVHGIADADVAAAPSFAAVAPRLLAELDRRGVPLGYNALRFDLPLLNAELARAGLARRIDATRVVDLLPFVRWHHRGHPRRRLVDLCAHYGVPLGEAHAATADATATGLLFYKLVDAGLVPPTVDETLREQARLSAALAKERRRWSWWLYADRHTGALRIGAGPHIGRALSEVSAGVVEALLAKAHLPQAARDALRARLS